MSYTTVKSVWLNDRAGEIEELRNSHGSAPVIWDEIAKKYLGVGDFEYHTRTDDLWPLYKRPEMPHYHRTVLMMSYDNALVMKDNYKQAASDIRAFLIDFPPKPNHVNHWNRIADIFDSEHECPAIGFHMTSVSEDPFQGSFNEENDEYDAPDWNVFWDVYQTAKKWIVDVNQNMKIFKIDDGEWWIGESADVCVEAYIAEYGSDVGTIEADEVSEAGLDNLTFVDTDEDERPTGITRTFREQMVIEIVNGGDFPRMFAVEQ